MKLYHAGIVALFLAFFATSTPSLADEGNNYPQINVTAGTGSTVSTTGNQDSHTGIILKAAGSVVSMPTESDPMMETFEIGLTGNAGRTHSGEGSYGLAMNVGLGIGTALSFEDSGPVQSGLYALVRGDVDGSGSDDDKSNLSAGAALEIGPVLKYQDWLFLLGGTVGPRFTGSFLTKNDAADPLAVGAIARVRNNAKKNDIVRHGQFAGELRFNHQPSLRNGPHSTQIGASVTARLTEGMSYRGDIEVGISGGLDVHIVSDETRTEAAISPEVSAGFVF